MLLTRTLEIVKSGGSNTVEPPRNYPNFIEVEVPRESQAGDLLKITMVTSQQRDSQDQRGCSNHGIGSLIGSSLRNLMARSAMCSER